MPLPAQRCSFRMTRRRRTEIGASSSSSGASGLRAVRLRRRYLALKQVCTDLRNSYAVLWDRFQKNYEKLDEHHEDHSVAMY